MEIFLVQLVSHRLSKVTVEFRSSIAVIRSSKVLLIIVQSYQTK